MKTVVDWSAKAVLRDVTSEGALDYSERSVEVRDGTRSRGVVIDVAAIARPYPEVGVDGSFKSTGGCSGGACKCAGGKCEGHTSQSRARYDPLSFLNPLEWLGGFRLGAPDPATQYRIISYDAHDGVRKVRRFDGALRLIIPMTATPIAARTRLGGWWLRGLGAVARRIIDGRGTSGV